MLGINGRPFISFDDELDISMMSRLHNEICLGLSMINTATHECCKCMEENNESPDLYDYRYKDISDVTLTPDDEALLTVMNREQRRRFMLIKYGVYYPWTYLVRFLTPVNWFTKHLALNKTIPTLYWDWFPEMLDFCYSLPMFSEIGRIDIFGVHPNNPIQCHRDRNPALYPRDDEFIMISPILKKPLYIYDPISKEKHFLNNHVVSFNDMDYHGADAILEFSYTIRVDGVFKPEYKERMHYGRQDK